MKYLISVLFIASLSFNSCNVVTNIPPSCQACIDSLLPLIIDSLQNDIEFQVLNTGLPESEGLKAASGSRTAAILHVICLNAKASTMKHKFIMTLPENYLTDTSFSGLLVRQLKYMNLQGSHGAPYPSSIYPFDSIFYNKQGKICELWIAQSQAQIDRGSKEWIENLLDANYARHTLEMENSRGRKLIYPNLPKF